MNTERMRTTCAVVVTYNRLSLLQHCLSRLEAQGQPLSRIVVVDNCSSDGSSAWLESWQAEAVPGLVKTLKRLPVNTGGAGGFSEGLKAAHAGTEDDFWLMDDDTLPQPGALQVLSVAMARHPAAGFVCSNVRWTDGSAHLMNLPGLALHWADGLPFNAFGEFVRIRGCSFVSVLIRREAVSQVGLPYREFFIWADDWEYTQRIAEAGWIGLYAPQSEVVHATATNYNADALQEASPANAWKFRYGTRNELFLKRLKRGQLSYANALFKTLRKALRVRWRNKVSGRAISQQMWTGCLESLTFHPTIEKLP